MRTKALWTVVVALMLSSLFFQGCASKHKPLSFNDSQSLNQPIKVARYIDQKYYVIHSAGQNAAAIMSGVNLPAGIAIQKGIVEAWAREVEKEIAAADVPKINVLVMNKFVKRAGKEIPGWPPMIIEEQSIRNIKDYFKQYLGTKMLFLNNAWGYPTHLSTGHGFVCYFDGYLANPEGDIIWKKRFTYISKEYGRQRSIEEYKADNFELDE